MSGMSPVRQIMPVNVGSIAIWSADGYLADGGASGRAAPAIVTGGGTPVLSASDQVILVNNTTAAPMTLTLPPGQSVGQFLWVKDNAGNAGTYNITVGPAIDGISQVLASNYASLQLVWNGTAWGTL